MNKPKAIIVDLDGTLVDNNHRLHLLLGDKPNWEQWDEGVPHDKPNQWCLDILYGMLDACMLDSLDHYAKKNTLEILFITGRGSRLLLKTKKWLKKHFNDNDLNYKLYMRQEGDSRPDFIVKKNIYRDYIRDEYNVLFCLEDKNSVADMWRKEGLVCLHCDNWTTAAETAIDIAGEKINPVAELRNKFYNVKEKQRRSVSLIKKLSKKT